LIRASIDTLRKTLIEAAINLGGLAVSLRRR